MITELDSLIKVAVPVVMVSAHFFGGCTCKSGMPVHRSVNHQTNNVEIAALCAPRPMLLISDGGDWTSNNPRIFIILTFQSFSSFSQSYWKIENENNDQILLTIDLNNEKKTFEALATLSFIFVGETD